MILVLEFADDQLDHIGASRDNFFCSSCAFAFELNMNHINFFLYVCTNWFWRNNQWSKISDQKIFFQKLLYHFHPPFTVCFLISGNSLKELPENCPNGNFLQKNIFTFGAAKTKCQQRTWVFQLILINWNPTKMIKKVSFEKAWELTLQSHLKSVRLVKKSMKSWFLWFFWKKAFTLD